MSSNKKRSKKRKRSKSSTCEDVSVIIYSDDDLPSFSSVDKYLNDLKRKRNKIDESNCSSPSLCENVVHMHTQAADIMFGVIGAGFNVPGTDFQPFLADLLCELPFPTPLPGVIGHQCLFSHLEDSEKACQFLNNKDSLQTLIEALNCTTMEEIKMKDENNCSKKSNEEQKSPLLKCLLQINPAVFKDPIYEFIQKDIREYSNTKQKSNLCFKNAQQLSDNRRKFTLKKRKPKKKRSLGRESFDDGRLSLISLLENSNDVSSSNSLYDRKMSNDIIVSSDFIVNCAEIGNSVQHQFMSNSSLNNLHCDIRKECAETTINKKLTSTIDSVIQQSIRPRSEPKKLTLFFNGLAKNKNSSDKAGILVLETSFEELLLNTHLNIRNDSIKLLEKTEKYISLCNSETSLLNSGREFSLDLSYKVLDNRYQSLITFENTSEVPHGSRNSNTIFLTSHQQNSHAMSLLSASSDVSSKTLHIRSVSNDIIESSFPIGNCNGRAVSEKCQKISKYFLEISYCNNAAERIVNKKITSKSDSSVQPPIELGSIEKEATVLFNLQENKQKRIYKERLYAAEINVKELNLRNNTCIQMDITKVSEENEICIYQYNSETSYENEHKFSLDPSSKISKNRYQSSNTSKISREVRHCPRIRNSESKFLILHPYTSHDISSSVAIGEVFFTPNIKSLSNDTMESIIPSESYTEKIVSEQCQTASNYSPENMHCNAIAKSATDFEPATAKCLKYSIFTEHSYIQQLSLKKRKTRVSPKQSNKKKNNNHPQLRKKNVSINKYKRKFNSSIEKVNKKTSNSRVSTKYPSSQYSKVIQSNGTELINLSESESKYEDHDEAREHLSQEVLMGCRLFNRVIKDILDSQNAMDVLTRNDEGSEYFAETSLIPSAQLQELSTAASELKRLHAKNYVPYEKIHQLLTILERNLTDDIKVLSINLMQESIYDLTAMERVLRVAVVSLSALGIMTYFKLFQKVILEKTVTFLKYQLQNTVFPEFDQIINSETKIGKLYNKDLEILNLLNELLDGQTLDDRVILLVSDLCVNTFFLNGIYELQINALCFVINVFSRYEKLRHRIMHYISEYVTALPSGKTLLRNYRLISGDYIHMYTASILLMIQSVFAYQCKSLNRIKNLLKLSKNNEEILHKDIDFIKSYEKSKQLAFKLLNDFAKSCFVKRQQGDYTPLFEDFVKDVLCTLYKPEWPVSGLILCLLVQSISNIKESVNKKSEDVIERGVNLFLLGLLAAAVRRHAVIIQDRKILIDDVFQRLGIFCEDASTDTLECKALCLSFEKCQILQKIILQFVDSSVTSFSAARKYYIVQWYMDAIEEIKSFHLNNEEVQKNDNNKDKNVSNFENDKINAQFAFEEKKHFILSLINKRNVFKNSRKKKLHIDYATAETITQYLLPSRHILDSFDSSFLYILQVISEPSSDLRTEATICLSLVVETDPNILIRSDIRKSFHQILLDQSPCVKETVVDLLDKHIFICPQITNEYYDMLFEIILDANNTLDTRVRKNVSNILKNICFKRSDLPKIPEICVQILKLIDDKDDLEKLIRVYLQIMLFNPICNENKPGSILQTVLDIAYVVKTCNDNGLKWFEIQLTSVLKNNRAENHTFVLKRSKQIVDWLIDYQLQTEKHSQNIDADSNFHSISSLETLYLFCKCHAPFFMSRATKILPIVTKHLNAHSHIQCLNLAVEMLGLILPFVKNHSGALFAETEQCVVDVLLKRTEIEISRFRCLVQYLYNINTITQNYHLARNCFETFFDNLLESRKEYENKSGNNVSKSTRTKILRSLHVIKFFFQHFDFDKVDVGSKQSDEKLLKNEVVQFLLQSPYFNYTDEKICRGALLALYFIIIRYPEFMLKNEVEMLYVNILASREALSALKCQVLKNISKYLLKHENNQQFSEAASSIANIYMDHILVCVMHADTRVRESSISVCQTVLRQGLIYPHQIVPYLVCLSSDISPAIRTEAENLLHDIEIGNAPPDLIKSKVVSGVRMSYGLHQLFRKPDEIIRGFECINNRSSRNSFLYSAIRPNMENRRVFLIALFELFVKPERTALEELLFIADNIVYFPYLIEDEPLFIIQYINSMIFSSLSKSLERFREALLPKQSFLSASQAKNSGASMKHYDDEDEVEDFDSILKRLPDNTSTIEECIRSCQNCELLSHVKSALQKMYPFTKLQITRYSLNKIPRRYERPLRNRSSKHSVRFNPRIVLSFVKSQEFECELNDKGKRRLVKKYFYFKQLLTRL